MKYFDGKDSITSDTWMAEDLAYDAEYPDQTFAGSKYFYYDVGSAMDSLKSGCGTICSDCMWYCNLPENFQGICPDGWRLPSFAKMVIKETRTERSGFSCLKFTSITNYKS